MIKCYLINGVGRSGKNTFIEYVEEIINKEYLQIQVIDHSTVDRVKEAMELLGWNRNDKSDEARNFMSELKNLSEEFNNFPNNECVDMIKMIVEDPHNFGDYFVFFHVREAKNIKELKERIMGLCEIKSILIEREDHVAPNCDKDDPKNINSISYNIHYKAKDKNELMNSAIDFIEKEKFNENKQELE